MDEPLAADEHLSWTVHFHDGRMNTINGANLRFEAFRLVDEGMAICRAQTNGGQVIDEKHVFLTSDRKCRVRSARGRTECL